MNGRAGLYGQSLYDLAAEEGLEEEIKEELDVMRGLFRENPAYVRLLGEPSLPLSERLGLIDTALSSGAQPYFVNFLKLLCEKGLLGEYGWCCDAFTQRYNAEHGIAEAVVTSAFPLTKEQEEALASKLEAMSQKKVCLTVKTDPGVLGGLRVEMEGRLYDGTVAGRVAGISRKLEELVV